ncbi:formylglycine-generating enzyme family protein [Luteolibacter sp. AS25]|uniref:formylglycine-generating enzyme family protein n=1 Tax=Luteolibacter sp. AS25 TaxID=3135776 RepID=UPI00398AFF01
MQNQSHPETVERLTTGLLKMVSVPSGRYAMGGMEDDKFVSEVELPSHEVTVERGFLISETPVTRDEWCEVMGGIPAGNLPGLPGDVPVVSVSFADAQTFCREIGENHRLPSEAEWEFACRGGRGTIFPNGSNISTEEANYFYDELGFQIGKGRLMPVRSYGANEFGLFDTVGNVCEWVADVWHPGYAGAPSDAQPWLEGGKRGYRVIRGGGWDHLPRVLRASWRDWAPEAACWDNLGFRVVKDL